MPTAQAFVAEVAATLRRLPNSGKVPADREAPDGVAAAADAAARPDVASTMPVAAAHIRRVFSRFMAYILSSAAADATVIARDPRQSVPRITGR